MNKQIFIFIFLLTCRICNGQNLVPNPTFEDTILCPNSTNQVDRAVGWHPSRNTPDYFHECDWINGIPGVPYNFTGFQYAHSGTAYCGIIPYSRNDSAYRECFTCQLISPLVIGTKYYVSFYASHADLNYRLSINKLGMLFSTNDYNMSNNAPINNFCHFYSDSIITDTLNWILLSGSFIADSAYNYLSMGNFFESYLTDTIYHFPSYADVYYYIDDVCVSTDSLYNEVWTSLPSFAKNQMLTIFPNPFSSIMQIETNNNELTEIILYDIASRKLLQKKFINSISLSTEQLAKGIYIYEVRNKNGVIKKGKVVKE